MKKILNFILGAVIVFSVLYFSAYLIDKLNITFPSPVLGIIILFTLLELKIVKDIWIKDFCEFILKDMILFFIPLFVGIVSYCNVVIKNIVPILITVILTTLFIMAFVAIFIEYGIKYTRLYKLKLKRRLDD